MQWYGRTALPALVREFLAARITKRIIKKGHIPGSNIPLQAFTCSTQDVLFFRNAADYFTIQIVKRNIPKLLTENELIGVFLFWRMHSPAKAKVNIKRFFFFSL
jgi:hypothetical protein